MALDEELHLALREVECVVDSDFLAESAVWKAGVRRILTVDYQLHLMARALAVTSYTETYP